MMRNLEIQAALNVIAVYVFTLLACLFAGLSFYHLYFLVAVVGCLYLIALAKLTASLFTNKATSLNAYRRAFALNAIAIALTLIFATGMSIWFLRETEFAKADVLFFILFAAIPVALLLVLLINNTKVLYRLTTSST